MASDCKTGLFILNSDLAKLGAECFQMPDTEVDYLHLEAAQCSSGSQTVTTGLPD
uniref:Uncharacterized protein n=1 Tax=Prolemur simus TaxID=1328070 RepID=A0A8C8ZRF0_PROSS